MNNKITNKTKNAVISMLRDGKSKVEIAEECGISPFAVGRIIYNSQFIDVGFESDNTDPLDKYIERCDKNGCSKA